MSWCGITNAHLKCQWWGEHVWLAVIKVPSPNICRRVHLSKPSIFNKQCLKFAFSSNSHLTVTGLCYMRQHTIEWIGLKITQSFWHSLQVLGCSFQGWVVCTRSRHSGLSRGSKEEKDLLNEISYNWCINGSDYAFLPHVLMLTYFCCCTESSS